jgi:uncharacterized protein YuzE
MKVIYDREVDVLSILLSDAPVAESDQDKPGVILDYDDRGNMVGFEILDASKVGSPTCCRGRPITRSGARLAGRCGWRAGRGAIRPAKLLRPAGAALR